MFDRETEFIGGAAVVAKHLAAAGADVTFTTVLGDDRCRSVVMADLLNAGIKCLPLIDKSRPTTQKRAYVVNGHRILKVDTLDNSSISDSQLTTMTNWLSNTHADGVVFSDFRHGIFNQRTIPAFIEAIPRRAFRSADSQVATRWGNVLQFADFDLITPNEREARHALGDQDSGIRPLASRLYDAARCGVCLLKLGDRGVLGCLGSDHAALDSFVVVDSLCDGVVDAVGAGDALLAYATLAMMAKGGPVQAAILGSMAAAIKVGREGNVVVTADDMRAMIDKVEEAME
jgi:bifunctional ADP-heptose synthase (sugar kinase/adenylyltransferase)